MKKIKIKGFQSHKSSELNLHPNVNIIVGQSSSGKTAIFRAIEWLNTNRPLGTRFISHGETQAEVTIDDVRGTKTDKGKTYYELANNRFDSGSNVPDLVTNALNINPINFQDQLSEHFLITSSPGEVARTFNRILNIEKVDEYVSKLSSLCNDSKNNLESKAKRKESQTARLNELSYLNNLKLQVEELEAIIKIHEATIRVIDSLFLTIEDGKILEKTLQTEKIKKKRLVNALVQLEEPIKRYKHIQQFEELYYLAKDIEEYIIGSCQLVLDLKTDISKIDLEKPKEIKKKIEIIHSLFQDYDHYITRIETIEENKRDIGVNIQSSLDQYQKELEDYKICPICLAPINDVSHIIQEVRKRYL